MNVTIPRINPIRLRLVYGSVIGWISIDYSSYLPRFDLMSPRTKYQKGIYPNLCIYQDWLVNKELGFQIQTEFIPASSIITANMVDINTGASTALSQSNITPVGWIGDYIRKLSVTPVTSGFYYFNIFVNNTLVGNEDFRFYSDVFYVTDTLSTDKNLVEIQFKNSTNFTDFVFDDYYTTYYTGMFESVSPQIEKSVFEEDDGVNLLKTRSYSKALLTLTEIPATYIDVIGKQLECDSLLINGIEYVSLEGFDFEKVEKSNIGTLTAILTAKYSNGFMNYY